MFIPLNPLLHNYNGVLSLSLSNFSLISSLKGQGFDEIFSLYLDINDTSVVTLGGYNKNFIYPGSESFDFQSEHSDEWRLPMQGIIFDKYVDYMSTNAVVDCTSPAILGPIEDIEKLYSYMLTTYPCSLLNVNSLTCDCGDYPDLRLNLKGTQITIPASLLLKKTKLNTCALQISSHDQSYWVLGQVFLKAYYTIYNRTGKTITLALSNSKSLDAADAEKPTESIFSTDVLITAIIIVLVTLVIFIMAKLVYIMYQKRVLNAESEDRVPLL